MLNIIIKGGPVMIPIIIGSIFGFAIVIEKLLVLRKVSMDNYSFVQHIFRELKNRKFQSALTECEKNSNVPLATLFKIGIERRALAPERLEKILEQAGNNQIQKLEKRLGAFASIVSIEPLLGFLGTITGLIRAFMTWEKAGADITVSALSGGIYEAMITTAAGLIIAIPLYLFYNYFVARISSIAHELTGHSVQLIEMLSEVKE
jgi:biopolymer transport protein ExbB